MVERYGSSWTDHGAGTGPFMIKSVGHKVGMTLVPNPYWARTRVGLREEDIPLILSSDTAYNAYQTRQIDILGVGPQGIPARLSARLQRDPRFHVAPGMTTDGIDISQKHPLHQHPPAPSLRPRRLRRRLAALRLRLEPWHADRLPGAAGPGRWLPTTDRHDLHLQAQPAGEARHGDGHLRDPDPPRPRHRPHPLRLPGPVRRLALRLPAQPADRRAGLLAGPALPALPGGAAHRGPRSGRDAARTALLRPAYLRRQPGRQRLAFTPRPAGAGPRPRRAGRVRGGRAARRAAAPRPARLPLARFHPGPAYPVDRAGSVVRRRLPGAAVPAHRPPLRCPGHRHGPAAAGPRRRPLHASRWYHLRSIRGPPGGDRRLDPGRDRLLDARPDRPRHRGARPDPAAPPARSRHGYHDDATEYPPAGRGTAGAGRQAEPA